MVHCRCSVRQIEYLALENIYAMLILRIRATQSSDRVQTEFMTNTNCPDNLTLNNEEIKQLKDFTYLGSKMASTENDVKRRLGLGWATFWKLEKLWRSKSTPTELNVNLFKTTCLSILLYGCESWTLTQRLEDKLNSFATSCYRIMIGVKRLDFIRNEAD